MSVQAEVAKRVNEKLRRELGPHVLGLLQEPDVIEVMLNPDGSLWVERLGGQMARMGTMPPMQAESLMATVATVLKTQIDAQNPILECELPLDGSRFEALLPPICQAPVFTIRKKALQVFSLDDYVGQQIMTLRQREALGEAVEARHNIAVVGGTGSGKTTLANALIREIADRCPRDRLVVLEDTVELQPHSENVVALRTADHVSMMRLLPRVLRLRPDRIIVGEVRDGAALDLLKSWNTGHPGGVATIHANSATAGLIRLEQLVAEATAAPVHHLIAEAVNLVVFIAKAPEGRRVKELLHVTGYDGQRYQSARLEQEKSE
ncbi:MAG: P-type conjugative transfer ATPase TrbB [Paracoccaceae bacterium]|nr:P-type conjugative transfer ATPase TrbB [Paracoccaceae bacterium]